MEKILVVLGHGSRSKEFQDGFNQVVEMVQAKLDDVKVYGASMELCNPEIEEVIAKIVDENKELNEIKIVPFFLFAGIHIKEDIPEIIEKMKVKYPTVSFKFGKPIGADPVIADILIKRAEEIA